MRGIRRRRKSGRRSIFWPVSLSLYDRTWEDNGDAYLKSQVMERGVVVAVTGGIRSTAEVCDQMMTGL
jgi:hypothetical protein